MLADRRGRLAQAEEVGSQADNVRRGHGRARLEASVVGRDRAENTDAGRVDVHDGSIVGEGGHIVVGVGGAHGADAGLRGGRDGAGVDGLAESIAVASGHADKVAGLDQAGGGIVERLRLAAAKRHVDDNAVGAVALGSIRQDPIDAAQDRGAVPPIGQPRAPKIGYATLKSISPSFNSPSSTTAAVERLDGEQAGPLSHAVRGRGDRAGAMAAVAVVIGLDAVHKSGDKGGTALIFLTDQTLINWHDKIV